MPRKSSRLLLLCGLVGLWAPDASAGAAPPSKEQKKREELMRKLGIDKKKQAAPESDSAKQAPTDADEEFPPDEPEGDAGGNEPAKDADGKKAPRVTYGGRIHRLMERGCINCHAQGKMAGGTGYVMSGDVRTDYRAALRFVKKGKPDDSKLLTKGAGKSHGGGGPYKEGSSAYTQIATWIEQGAPLGGAPKTAPVAAAATTGNAANNPSATPGAAKSAKTRSPKATPSPQADGPTAQAPPAESEADAGPIYAPTVHQILTDKCASCHAQGSFAANGAFALSGDQSADYAVAKALTNPDQPAASPLLVKGIGEGHGGGASIAKDSPEYNKILAWIEAGSLGPTAAAASTKDDASVDAMSGATPTNDGSRLGDGTPGGPHKTSNIPLTLPLNLRLNGKFDFSYERRDFKNHPFGEGTNAFQTYHHFLFLSRADADDPFGIDVELLTQQFYEFNARFPLKNAPVRFLVKAGKLLVPFGAEPLFHNSYGGRAGFDQQILPVVWSQFGAAGHVNAKLGPVTLSDDLYTVQGYALRSEDSILNLQNDFSSGDEFKMALGNRIGLSWESISGWYSFYFNRLGFDRRLFMQALDLEWYRWRGIPVVEDFTLAVGFMRADISGGGAGSDYYHFGSYGAVRYYPLDFLYIQYRAGLRTTDNRRGLFFDPTRVDEKDGSSHNVSAMVRYKGAYLGFQIFWNLEKANEQDDDFLRLTVGYEF